MLEETVATSWPALSRVEGFPSAGSRLPNSISCFCNVCSHEWQVAGSSSKRFDSFEELVRRTGIRRDEITALAQIGALNTLGGSRRSALWQVERMVRPAGELFEESTADRPQSAVRSPQSKTENHGPAAVDSPLSPMTAVERLVADYAGTSLTIGPHPMSMRRHDLAMRGVLRAMDLPRVRTGRRVRTAGMVITRQRPGTAKGFVFLTLEDETGIANIIVRPDLYDQERMTIVHSPFLLVDGVLQTQDGVTSIRAVQLQRLPGLDEASAFDSHDFH